jgi:hypothetical protein
MQRWKEELILVGHEMEWTVRYFIYQSGVWRDRKSVEESMYDAGAAAYAARKEAMWKEMAVSAGKQFRVVNSLFKFTV